MSLAERYKSEKFYRKRYIPAGNTSLIKLSSLIYAGITVIDRSAKITAYYKTYSMAALIERFIGAAIRLLDPALCYSNIAHIQSKLASALAEEDMNF